MTDYKKENYYFRDKIVELKQRSMTRTNMYYIKGRAKRNFKVYTKNLNLSSR